MIRAWLFLSATLTLAAFRPAAASPASLLEPVPELVTVERIDGTTSTAARVEPWPGGFARLIAGDGKVSFLPVHDIRSIRDEEGTDATERVLRRRQGVGVAPAAPVLVDHPSPRDLKARDRPEFVEFQAGVLGRVNAVGGESNAAIAMDLGTMRNRSSAYALGGTLGVVGDEEYLRIALKPRLRRWMTNSFALDIAPGIFHAVDADDSPTRHGAVGFLLETSLLWRGMAVTGQLEVVDRERRTYEYVAPLHRSLTGVESGTEASYQLGVKLGGGAAVPAGVVLFLALLVVGSAGGEVY